MTATGERGSGLSGLVALKGAADLGLSGAPVVDGSGVVVGMVVADEDETGLKAVPAPTLGRASPSAPDKGSCGRPMGPQIPTVITGDAPEAAKATLQRYFAGINTGDYDAVFDAFEPGTLRGSRSEIEQGFRSTYDFNIRIEAWQGPNVWVRFDSIFAAGRGPRRSLTCARWSRVFVFGETRRDPDRPGGEPGRGAAVPCLLTPPDQAGGRLLEVEVHRVHGRRGQPQLHRDLVPDGRRLLLAGQEDLARLHVRRLQEPALLAVDRVRAEREPGGLQ